MKITIGDKVLVFGIWLVVKDITYNEENSQLDTIHLEDTQDNKIGTCERCDVEEVRS